MPIITTDPESSETFSVIANGMADAAREMASATRNCIKDAWFDSKQTIRGDLAFIDYSFWSSTEESFYTTLITIADKKINIATDADGELEAWLSGLQQQALNLFDQHIDDSAFQYGDPGRIVKARKKLRGLIHSKKIRALLFLPASRPNSQEEMNG